MRAIYKLSSISCACLSIEAYQPILSANNYCDFKAYGAFSNVMLTENEYESFCREYRNAEHVLNNLSLYMEANGVSYSNDYAELLIFAKKDGIENVGDIENISGNGNLNDVQKELYEKLRESAERGCPPLPFVMDILPEDVYQKLREIALNAVDRKSVV